MWSNIFGANRDPTIWGVDAAEWKPERWLFPLPDTVADARVPSVFANLYVTYMAVFRFVLTQIVRSPERRSLQVRARACKWAHVVAEAVH